MTKGLKTNAGLLLYRQLPEEYRYRDNRTETEAGDLEAFLHGFGHLFDLLRQTLEQFYADAFAEQADNGLESQTWILPYLAELLGTRLVSPDLDGTGGIRRRELNHAVAWSKGKGTLQVTDSVADVLADAETVVVEGWKRTATTPRLSLPPFSLPKSNDNAAWRNLLPLGTPDLRKANRAILDEAGTDPLLTYLAKGRSATDGKRREERVFWRHSERNGLPCFPGGFADCSVTTPDLRTNAFAKLGPAPRRVNVHVQPPAGFFEDNLLKKTLTMAEVTAFLQARHASGQIVDEIGPKEVFEILSLDPEDAPDRLNIAGDFSIPSSRNLAFVDLNFLGHLTVQKRANLTLQRCAASSVTVEGSGAAPPFSAKDCLLRKIAGAAGFARLEYVTVMETTEIRRLQASDCLFFGPFVNPNSLDRKSCVRYSRIPESQAESSPIFAKSTTNTFASVHFVSRPLETAGVCKIRQAEFEEASYGVLDQSTPQEIREGAEDGMEQGAYHHLGYAARLAAVARKLRDQLPLGQTVQICHDPMLAVKPPRVLPPA